MTHVAHSQTPPASPPLSPPLGKRNAAVRTIITAYRTRREWAVLPAVRAVVLEVEAALAVRDGGDVGLVDENARVSTSDVGA
jgi:hypothetical protein